MKVLILGGGASGLMAALSALENPWNTVTLLERQCRVGRKLARHRQRPLQPNKHAASAVAHYHGEAPDFAAPALEYYARRRTRSRSFAASAF